jgi:branched-chain amino acid transport system permease protein
MNFWLALLISILIAAFAGILLGLPVLRLRGDYLAIVTLGFGEIIRVLVKSDLLSEYLGGPQGIRDIAGPSIFGIPLDSESAFLYLIILGIILIIFITIRLQGSRIGRAWVAMREDETVAQAMGINTYYYKLLAFATGAAFAGLGGVLFASRNQYTGPEDHSLMVSINVLCLVIVGGMGSIPGVIVGAFVLKGLPEVLRDLESYRLLAFGALLVVMMIWKPEGLWPAPRRRLEFHEHELNEATTIEGDVQA